MMNLKKFVLVAVSAVSALVVTVPAHAAASPIDVTAVVADIAAQAAPIGLIGSAVLLIFVAVKAFKWVRAALS